MNRMYYVFPDRIAANACDCAIVWVGRPYPISEHDTGVRRFGSVQLLDGRAALMLDLEAEIVIHRDGLFKGAVPIVDWKTEGSIAALLRNFAGMPTAEEMDAWAPLVAGLQALPVRGDPVLEGREPVIAVPLAALLPASAQANLKTHQQLVDAGLLDAPVDPDPIDEGVVE